MRAKMMLTGLMMILAGGHASAQGPTIGGSVFGGGNEAEVGGSVTINMTAGTVEKDVYGGGALANTNINNVTAGYGTSSETISSTSVNTTTVNLLGGTIVGDAYGGGLGRQANNNVSPAVTAVEAKVYGDVKIYLNGMEKSFYDASDATMKAVFDTRITKTGSTFYLVKTDTKGAVVERVFGANNKNGSPQGNVTVHVFATQSKDASKTTVNQKFANENINLASISEVSDLKAILADLIQKGIKVGVTITSYQEIYDNTSATAEQVKTAINGINAEIKAKTSVENPTESESAAIQTLNALIYDVKAVYGGGNQAAYNPASPYTTSNTTGAKTQVIIEGCSLTSIETVYGGGNAAAVPETNVEIIEAYEIQSVFGGGNGYSETGNHSNPSAAYYNPGADVGVYNGSDYGTGDANAILKGGFIHEAYGGSNQMGKIKGKININTNPEGECALCVDKLVGAGKNADVDGDLIMILGCKPTTKTPLIFAGADNADVNGNVELTITSGTFGKVFGGNNLGGYIKGHIKLNIEETGCNPIVIDELYLGGNQAAYSIYGYYQDASDNNKVKPRTAAMHAITDTNDENYKAPVGNPSNTDGKHPFPYDQPVLNIISCTSIGKVFGGGYGAGATMYADPTVNINMIKGTATGSLTTLGTIGDVFGGGNAAEVVGNTTVNIGTETKVEMTSLPKVPAVEGDPEYNSQAAEQVKVYQKIDVLGANIVGNVYGGGNLADIGHTELEYDSNNNAIDHILMAGNTFVNICAVKGAEIVDAQSNATGRYNYTSVPFAATAVTITGSVFGGGKGEAAGLEDKTVTVAGAFRCGKAMVTGATNVAIGNGKVTGAVYGGGMVGRVEGNTTVSIGFGEGKASGSPDSAPVIEHDVFGAGKGVNTHGYSALVRGESTVTVAGNAWIKQSIYGGGEIASLGRYKVAQSDTEAAAHDVEPGMPYVLDDSQYPRSGFASVTVKGYAEVGKDDMQMKKQGGPDDTGYVFGAGKGILPYEDTNGQPGRIDKDDKWESYKKSDYGDGYEAAYLKYIETLSLTTQTYVTIGEHAFIKGSVYGGSENGHVQRDTYVYIKDHCQIGNGWDETKNSSAGGGVNERYDEDDFINPATVTADVIIEKADKLKECAHWDFGVTVDKNNDGEPDKDSNGNVIKVYLPYDKYTSASGGATTASDGHTFFGNVFGGGSGLYPYIKEKINEGDDDEYEWLRSAGRVYGNTNVEITGGHILTSVYGGCELTDVGNGLSVEANKGRCFVKMSGGTLGVPRTLAQIAAHPVTCYLFGAGKGDQRVHFNQWTNVGKVRVEINDSISQPIIYGSVFGGGEDGHVLGNVDIHIKKMNGRDPIIGTWGTSYVDGNVFGAGRGFGGDALTAGVVSGNVDIKIEGGKMRGSIYGGGRLGSVGTYLVPSDHDNYGKLIPDGKKQEITDGNVSITDGGGNHGHITVSISDGTIGNDYEYLYVDPNNNNDLSTLKTNNYIPNTDFEDYITSDGTVYKRLKHTKGGNVFAGAMGRLKALDNITTLTHWPDMGKARKTILNISGTAIIKSNVYGGGELGILEEGSEINIEGGTIGTEVKETVTTTASGETPASSSLVTRYTFGSVFGGGAGSEENVYGTSVNDGTVNTKDYAGLVKGCTIINMSNGTVKASVYGGGELAIVEGNHAKTVGKDLNIGADIQISGGTVGYNQDGFGGATMGNVYGGGKGSLDYEKAGLIKTNTRVEINERNGSSIIYHNIYGGGAYGSVGTFDFTTGVPENWTPNTGKADVTITGGTIGINGHENGMVFGSSRGNVATPTGSPAVDPNDKLAWVHDTHVVIGNSSGGPTINGTVYGSGENGHVFTNTVVDIHNGTIGIDSGTEITYTENGQSVTKGGAAYPYRGNVYGGGCGTDTYPVTVTEGEGEYAVTKTIQKYNPLAGIVLGNATVNIDGGHVIRNVYGAGAMGSVGSTDNTGAITSGGTTTIAISGGTIGVNGSAGDGNVFGAARGDKTTTQTGIAQVLTTDVTISGGAVKGNVYGGGEIGSVGTFYETDPSDGRYLWTSGGRSNVTVSGGMIGPENNSNPKIGNVFGAGKGEANTFKCEKAMVKETIVSISNGTVWGNVYGGGEIGRVETDTKVTVGRKSGEEEGAGTGTPDIKGSVFGGGAGAETHGYSALVRGNTRVTVEGAVGSKVGHSVYGGGEIASVGRYGLDEHKMPEILLEGGYCYVKVLGSATIGSTTVEGNVFGACKGVDPHFDKTNSDKSELSRRMTMYTNSTDFPDDKEGDTWEYYDESVSPKLVWEYFQDEDGYNKYLETLALATHPEVTINGSAIVNGSVFGGGELGLTKGSVIVSILGGTITKDVYGGGSLADTNTTSAVGVLTNGVPERDGDKYVTTTVHPKTKVSLLGGTLRDAYGGGLGRLGTANPGVHYTQAEADAYNAANSLETGDEGFVTTDSWKEPPVSAADGIGSVKATVHGNVFIDLNGTTTFDSDGNPTLDSNGYPVGTRTDGKGCVVHQVFGGNNYNGTPLGNVTVHVYGTLHKDLSSISEKYNPPYCDPEKASNEGYKDYLQRVIDTAYQKDEKGNLISPKTRITDIPQSVGDAVDDAETILSDLSSTAEAGLTDEQKTSVTTAANNIYQEYNKLYDVYAVYGGGNQAAYEPTKAWDGTSGSKAQVVIEGCDFSSIQYVYGGGNAAPVPETNILIKGTKIIDNLFGGGNGTVVGADIGYKKDGTSTQGTGNVSMLLMAGNIHNVFGGSNTNGNIRGNVNRRTVDVPEGHGAECCNVLRVNKYFGAGKNADIEGDLIDVLGCQQSTWIDEYYGGAENANVKGNVELTITSGRIKKLFGGNKTSGAIFGHIILNIEETGDCGTPIEIDELYGCGNDAAYSVYGYKNTAEEGASPVYVPRTSLDDGVAVTFANNLEHTTPPYDPPVVNIISATHIGKVYGGGFGSNATVYGNPTVNINMIPGSNASGVPDVMEALKLKDADKERNSQNLGIIGDVYGGGNAANVEGNTTVNICAKKKVDLHLAYNSSTKEYRYESNQPVKGAMIIGDVFGGGNKADVLGNTYVNISSEMTPVLNNNDEPTGDYTYTKVTLYGDDYEGISIGASVYGGGSEADVKGNTHVQMSDGYVFNGIFGGGLAGSVGDFTTSTDEKKIPELFNHTSHTGCTGKPISCQTGTGKCTVVVDGGQIGPKEVATQGMRRLDKDGGPVPQGWVWGGSCGIVADPSKDPDSQFKAYVNETDVTIGGTAFVLESIIGGGEFGRVLGNTKVTIQDHCQIGVGEGQVDDNGKPIPYNDNDFIDPTDSNKPITDTNALTECSHFPFGKDVSDKKVYECYDPYADAYKKAKGSYLYPGGVTDYASDGKTWIGCVFGGGSGYMPYINKENNVITDYDWVRSAGLVEGNSEVVITGGHILTNVYGGNEYTDVLGKSTVKMSGGTVGVPRTQDQIKALPVCGYIYGAGKGDERTRFNTMTNVGSAEVEVSGGIVYGSVYGGGEDGHVLGDVKVTIKDGAIIGTCGTSYFDGNVFGGGRGLSGIAQTAGTVGGNVTLNIEGGTMLGSVYGGGRLASVGTQFTAPNDDNYGNFQEDETTGVNPKRYGHVTVNISGGTIGNDLENVSYPSTVSTSEKTPEQIKEARDAEIAALKAEHHLPYTVFEYDSEKNKYVVLHSTGGNVFGGSMGRLTLLDGTINDIWPKMAQVKTTAVNIYRSATVKRNVYGGGELGTVRDNACVTIGGYLNPTVTDGSNSSFNPVKADSIITSTNEDVPIIYRDVYGGGYGSEDDDHHTVFTVKEPTVNTYAFTPMQFAGCVGQNTFVHIVGGQVRKSVYGGGEMASVGIIDGQAETVTSPAANRIFAGSKEGTDYYYKNIFKNEDKQTVDGKEVVYGFALSWPYKFNYMPGFYGETHVNVTGGRIGSKTGDPDIGTDNGDVYGAGKGLAGDYKDYVFCANVGSTKVNINLDSEGVTPANYEAGGNCISGAVYGGGENGHVMRDTYLKLENGFIGHSIYGAGSGKGKFLTDRLLKIGATAGSTNADDHYTREIYSITAGKVFGNSTIDMSGGYVVRNVYGGGNMGSVGKGNYSGGTDDYSTSGYGETLNGSLWDGESDNSKAFLGSGICTVNITGGTVGYIDTSDPSKTMYSNLPYGNVFGGSRGASAPNIKESPRYLYSPEFFLGYVNETIVNIGIAAKPASGTTEGGDYVAAIPASGPTIAGSVYGGGMDGHVRRDATVTINGGTIGRAYTGNGTTDLNNAEWLFTGNVFGAGSGIGKYKYDFDYDGKYDNNQYPYGTKPGTDEPNYVKEEDFSTSAGSVTRFTTVTINGGTIHRNVYGGGSLSSIGAPKIPTTRTDDPIRRDDSEDGKATLGKQSLNQVNIAGGQIGDETSYAAGYGGYVYGASRGDATLTDPASFATSVWTEVNINPHATDPTKSPIIYGDVYGGGEVGSVKHDTKVELTGGTIKHDVYGGGKGTDAVAADVGGTTLVELNKDVRNNARGCVVSRLFGGNNVNGTPGGKTQVYVYATQSSDDEHTTIDSKFSKHTDLEAESATSTYDVQAVYGGGNLSPFEPNDAKLEYTAANKEKVDAARTEVYIYGCDLTSIKQVYGGGNSASTPATMVTVNSAYEIQDLFGGGDGQGSVSGANVGYTAYDAAFDPPASSKEVRTEKFAYGSGVASLNIYGGRIHRVFGGSNTKGNVRETAITMLDNQDPCPLDIDEAYGGGKSAPMDAEAILHMACIPGLKVAFGGAQEADVLNNVVLNITNGTYDRVFGGNNISGTIKGSITVNIEETGCKPLIIGELYGGGNLAGYSVYGYKQMKESDAENAKLVWMPRESDTDNTADGEVDAPATPYDDPQINVKSFTSIGNIYGGGLGTTAVMVGNPTVNIDEVKGKYADYVGDPAKYAPNYDYDATGFKGMVKTFDGKDVTIPSHAKGAIGAIQNVFGGGNAAEVKGNTNVNIGTLDEVTFETDYETDGEGHTVYETDGKTPKKKTVPVVGVDIRGNVYGGGNNAEVTGDTNVVIGKEKVTTP